MKISPLQNVELQSFNCKLWYIYQLCSCEQKLSCCRLQPKKKLVTDRHESWSGRVQAITTLIQVESDSFAMKFYGELSPSAVIRVTMHYRLVTCAPRFFKENFLKFNVAYIKFYCIITINRKKLRKDGMIRKHRA